MDTASRSAATGPPLSLRGSAPMTSHHRSTTDSAFSGRGMVSLQDTVSRTARQTRLMLAVRVRKVQRLLVE